jgi:hypothetical protein
MNRKLRKEPESERSIDSGPMEEHRTLVNIPAGVAALLHLVHQGRSLAVVDFG